LGTLGDLNETAHPIENRHPGNKLFTRSHDSQAGKCSGVPDPLLSATLAVVPGSRQRVTDRFR
jgi:hypothetical protein